MSEQQGSLCFTIVPWLYAIACQFWANFCQWRHQLLAVPWPWMAAKYNLAPTAAHCVLGLLRPQLACMKHGSGNLRVHGTYTGAA